MNLPAIYFIGYKMKIPAAPPDADKIISKLVREPKKLAALNSLQQFLSDLPYDHWEKLRFRPMPDPLTAAEVWSALKFNRRFSQKFLPFSDLVGRRFTYVPTGDFQRALHEIDSYARGLIGMPGAAATVEGRDVYLQKSLLEEPFSSSVLEGAATTREIARKMIEEARPPKTQDERMVLNNYEAMNFVREHRDEPLTPARILEIHRILTKDTLDRPEKVGVLRSAGGCISG